MALASTRELAAEAGRIVTSQFFVSLKVSLHVSQMIVGDTNWTRLNVAPEVVPTPSRVHPSRSYSRSSESNSCLTDADSILCQNLDTLLKRLDDDVVQQWSEEYPCQLPPLAGAVLEALPIWPYALSVLERLCKTIGSIWTSQATYSR